jgi:hypothetical protein
VKENYLEDNETLQLTIEADENCTSQGELVQTYVHLDTFSFMNPSGHRGELHEPDLMVIYDKEFDIVFDFPLNNPITLHVQTDNEGFSIREILQLIKIAYEQIYHIESITANENTFEIEYPCTCVNIPLDDYVQDSTAVEEMCSICRMDLSENVGRLECSHLFHKACLTQWFEMGRGTSCPLCRNSVSSCDTCNGSLTTVSEIQAVVLPIEYRPSFHRNDTDGVFGIHSYDINHLIIEEMIYNKIQKRLKINMSII